jgi:plastocyanin
MSPRQANRCLLSVIFDRRSQLAILVVLAWLSNMHCASAKTIQIVLESIAFLPSETTVVVGDTVEWINRDIVAHTATAKNGDWDVTIPAGQTQTLLVRKAGQFEYYCRFHPNMTGLLRMTD